MGTKPLKGDSAPIRSALPFIQKALKEAGHRVRFYTGGAAENAPGILIVDEAVTIGDNLESDPGDNYNVTAALDLMPFNEVKKIYKRINLKGGGRNF
jgi:hypothetical protein